MVALLGYLNLWSILKFIKNQTVPLLAYVCKTSLLLLKIWHGSIFFWRSGSLHYMHKILRYRDESPIDIYIYLAHTNLESACQRVIFWLVSSWKFSDKSAWKRLPATRNPPFKQDINANLSTKIFYYNCTPSLLLLYFYMGRPKISIYLLKFDVFLFHSLQNETLQLPEISCTPSIRKKSCDTVCPEKKIQKVWIRIRAIAAYEKKDDLASINSFNSVGG